MIDAIPMAVKRAESLDRHARQSGAPRNLFLLLLTIDEGWELVRWFQAHPSEGIDPLLLAVDVKTAEAENDPWVVLQHFQLSGFTIMKREDSVH